MLNMTNTLIIGTPTAGVLAFNVTYPNMNLPRTGIGLSFGRTMNLWSEDHFSEGVGIQPDIWAQRDALNTALALLREAGLTTE